MGGGAARHPVGWLLLAAGLCLNASGVASASADYGLLARPGAVPAAGEVSLYLPATVVPALAVLGFVLLLTPTGSLPSPRWRWWARAAVAVPVVSLLVIVLAPRSFDAGSRTPENPFDLTGLGGALLVVYQLTFAVTNLAVVVGAAILRYRLYDLDRIISRALAYGLLTVLLGGGYAVVVLGLGQLLGRDSSLAVPGPPGRGRPVPAGRRVTGRRPALQPAPPRRRHHHRGVQRPAAPADRPGHPHGRAAGPGRPDDAADPRLAVAPVVGHHPRRPTIS